MSWLLWGGSAGFAWARSILRKEDILKSYTAEITEEQLNTEDALANLKLPITKALDEELMQVTYVAMLPDSTDLHGDYTSAEDVRKAKESFNKSMQRANLFHMVMTDTFEICESYLAPTDFVLGEQFVAKGTWLVTLQVHDDTVWNLIKSGEINGVSIGATAKVTNLETEEE